MATDSQNKSSSIRDFSLPRTLSNRGGGEVEGLRAPEWPAQFGLADSLLTPLSLIPGLPAGRALFRLAAGATRGSFCRGRGYSQ